MQQLADEEEIYIGIVELRKKENREAWQIRDAEVKLAELQKQKKQQLQKCLPTKSKNKRTSMKL